MRPVKFDQEKNNPCLKEANLSFKCLSDNAYDKDKCSLPIENYNMCKKFWSFVKQDRKNKGITPHLPEPKDRETIKSEYFKSYTEQLNK